MAYEPIDQNWYDDEEVTFYVKSYDSDIVHIYGPGKLYLPEGLSDLMCSIVQGTLGWNKKRKAVVRGRTIIKIGNLDLLKFC